MIFLLFQPTESRCPTCSLPLCDLETDKNNNKTSVNNDNNNNTSSDCELGVVCDKFKHFEECELLRSLSKYSKQPVPSEVSQLAIIATRMAKVVDKEEVALLMDHLEDRVQLRSKIRGLVVSEIDACQAGQTDDVIRRKGHDESPG